MIGLLGRNPGFLSVKDHHAVFCQVRQVRGDGPLVEGDQQVHLVPEGLNGMIADPHLGIVVPSPNPRLHILVDEDVVPVAGEYLAHDGRDGLHSLPCLSPDPDRYIQSHGSDSFLVIVTSK